MQEETECCFLSARGSLPAPKAHLRTGKHSTVPVSSLASSPLPGVPAGSQPPQGIGVLCVASPAPDWVSVMGCTGSPAQADICVCESLTGACPPTDIPREADLSCCGHLPSVSHGRASVVCMCPKYYVGSCENTGRLQGPILKSATMHLLQACCWGCIPFAHLHFPVRITCLWLDAASQASHRAHLGRAEGAVVVDRDRAPEEHFFIYSHLGPLGPHGEGTGTPQGQGPWRHNSPVP